MKISSITYSKEGEVESTYTMLKDFFFWSLSPQGLMNSVTAHHDHSCTETAEQNYWRTSVFITFTFTTVLNYYYYFYIYYYYYFFFTLQYCIGLNLSNSLTWDCKESDTTERLNWTEPINKYFKNKKGFAGLIIPRSFVVIVVCVF